MKRALEAGTNSPIRSGSPMRVGQADGSGQPTMKELDSNYRLDLVPNDVLRHIAFCADLATCRTLFEVCRHFNQTLAGAELLHPEFNYLVDFDSFISWLAMHSTALLEQRFSCAQFLLKGENYLANLYELAVNGAIKHLKLVDFSSNMSALLPTLDQKVAERSQAGDPDPHCHLLLDIRSSPAPDASVLNNLKHLEITALATADPAWVKLVPHMPGLGKLSIHAIDEAQCLLLLASRSDPVFHMAFSHCERSEQEDAQGYCELLTRLNVERLSIEPPEVVGALRNLEKCKLNWLHLKGAFIPALVSELSRFLQESEISTLILSDGEDRNLSETVANMTGLVEGLEINDSLTHLDVRLDADYVGSQYDLLTTVVRKENINFARIPYPLEFQTVVKTAMADEPNLKIVRTNDYREEEAELLGIVKEGAALRAKVNKRD